MKKIILIPILFLLISCTSLHQNENPPKFEETQKAKTHTTLAIAYLEQQQFEVAKIEAMKALHFMPSDINALHTIALASLGLNEISYAKENFESALNVFLQKTNVLQKTDLHLINNYLSLLCSTGETEKGLKIIQLIDEVKKLSTIVNASELASRCRKLSNI